MSKSKKILLVGWDAADWKVIGPLMRAGHMPATKSLCERGVSGNITTLFPALSPMLWTSIATGKRPYKHGIYGFYEPTPNKNGVQPMTNISRQSKAVWNILNQQGMKSNVVGWWPSHPAEPISGAMVSDYYHKVPKKPGDPWTLAPNAIHPPRCFEELQDLRVHPLEMTAEQIVAFVPHMDEVDQETDGRMSQCARTLAECTSIHTAATHLMETEPWDFMAVYYDAIDHFSHGFMRYHPPQQDHISDKDFRLYQHVITAGYIYHDMMLATLLEMAGDDTTVILMSDHGFHPDHLRLKQLPSEPAGPASEHRDLGIFVIAGPGIKKGQTIEGTSLLDITPTILTAYGLPVGEDMDGRILAEVFESVPVIQTIPSWEDVPGETGEHPEGFLLSDADSKAALDQLVALGYIEPVDDNAEVAIKSCNRELDFNLARSYMDGGLHGEAIPLLGALYRKFPLEFRFGIQLANCLHAMQHFDDLERLIDDINGRWRKTREEAQESLKGITKVMKARREQWEEFKKIDEQNKDNAEPTPKLARVTPTGRPILFSDSEMRLIQTLQAVSKGNPQTLDFLQSSVAISKGDYPRALEIMKESGLHDTDSPVFQTQVGHVYLKLEQLDEAERCFEHALRLDEYYSNALVGQCQLAMARGDVDAALEIGTRAVGLKHQFPAAHYYLGMAQQQNGETDKALESFRTALGLNPNFVEAHKQLEEILGDSFETGADALDHRQAARELRAEAREARSSHEPIELPEMSDEELRAALPELPKEDPSVSEKFFKCIGQPPEAKERSTRDQSDAVVTVVSGLPRSGTSMMMQMLAAAGLKAHSDGERIADENNPKGYYEAEAVKQLSHKNSWMPECEGRAVKVIAQLIPYLPQRLNYRVVFMDRSIDEVLVSQNKMLKRLDTEGGNIQDERLGEVYENQVKFSLNLLQAHQVPVLRVSYADAISDPAKVAAKVAEFLGVDLDVAAMTAAVDSKLYRERKP